MVPIQIRTALSALALLPWETVATAPKVVGYDFDKVRRELPSRKLERRDGGTAVDLVNDQILYLVNISVGTPPQAMSVQLDTGSSDLWVPSVDSTLCRQNECGETGSFDASLSSSFAVLDGVHPFHIEYGDRSVYDGDLFVDTLNVGGTTTENVTMGLVNIADNVVMGAGPVGNGLWGINFAIGQANVVVSDDPPYPSVLQQMKKNGDIKSISYSLWLDSIDAKSGSILFGGVDSAKYTPPLIGVPIIKNPGSELYDFLAVEFTSLTLKDPSESVTLTDDGTVILALLDSGTTSSQLPQSLINKIYSYFGARLEFGHPYLPCNFAKANASLTFGFGGGNGPKINVPIGAFVAPPDGSHFHDGTEACPLLIDSGDDNELVLGDSFLRSAYVVYHLEIPQIALAQSNLSPGAPDITEIDGKTIPNVATVVDTLPLPTITTDASDATAAPATPTQAAVPSDFSGTFSDSAPKASFTAPSSTSKAAAAGGTAAMISSRGYIVCGTVSMLFALLGGSMMIFM